MFIKIFIVYYTFEDNYCSACLNNLYCIVKKITVRENIQTESDSHHMNCYNFIYMLKLLGYFTLYFPICHLCCLHICSRINCILIYEHNVFELDDWMRISGINQF